MDVSWTPPPQAFKRPSTAADTLTRLASFIARAESKTALSRTHQLPQAPQSAPNLPYTCSECGVTFTYATELLTHQDSQHTLPKPHQCPHCLQEFSLKSSLQIHNCGGSSQLYHGQASNSPTYATSLSNISENPIEDLAGTQHHVVDTNPFACAPCGQTFTQKQALLHHQQTGCDTTPSPPCLDNLESPALGSPLLSEEDSSSSNSLYAPDTESACKFCSRTFRNEAAFHRHTKLKTCDQKESCESSNGEDAKSGKLSKGGFSCRSCDMVFNCTAKLYMHRKEKHSRGIKYIIEPRPVVKRHRRPNNSTYTCQICSKVFFHHLSLGAYQKTPSICPRNSENVKSSSAKDTTEACTLLENPDLNKKVAPLKLTIRKNVWTKEAPPQPHQKIKLKTTFKSIKLQQQVPEGEDDNEEEDEEFPCPSCPEVFSQLSDLKTHSELHQTAVNRGKCSVCACEMDSSKRTGAKRIRLYHCSLCQRGFSALELFLSHCQDHLKARVEEDRLNGATTDT
ncbi:LOW QUALITY PROTEIN: zinc finger protein 594 [Boleophthalmus pectinirostris]|uniref:LOW QUALITY PROTEIN: zinc finger protein 594 n=1 Tax=Boleophthalmus pectinirostris TaxID=150288 RepID=UPI0024331D05|nr:LOW QUALITY PROTEIN: zinc finger protein 594 [Boleophthalmus pectinirostris]